MSEWCSPIPFVVVVVVVVAVDDEGANALVGGPPDSVSSRGD